MTRPCFLLTAAACLASMLGTCARAAVDCEKLKSSTEPFRLVLQATSTLGGQTPPPRDIVETVTREPDGKTVVIAKDADTVFRTTSTYGLTTFNHTRSDSVDFRNTKTFTLDGDPFAKKHDFTLSVANTIKVQTHEAKSESDLAAKYLGEQDMSVGPCTFHVLRYDIEAEGGVDGKRQPAGSSELWYAPALKIYLYNKLEPKGPNMSGFFETKATDIGTDLPVLKDPGE